MNPAGNRKINDWTNQVNKNGKIYNFEKKELNSKIKKNGKN